MSQDATKHYLSNQINRYFLTVIVTKKNDFPTFLPFSRKVLLRLSGLLHKDLHKEGRIRAKAYITYHNRANTITTRYVVIKLEGARVFTYFLYYLST